MGIRVWYSKISSPLCQADGLRQRDQQQENIVSLHRIENGVRCNNSLHKICFSRTLGRCIAVNIYKNTY